MSVYIYSIAHISNQEPFFDAWFDQPLIYDRSCVRSIEPDFKTYIAPSAARRMGSGALKKTLTTALHVIRETGIENPDAIITGTGLGCVEETEKFMDAMMKTGEELLPPTPFMQSTHNTIGSQIALYIKCNGYNSTYSHGGISFDSALLDAFMQFQLGKISTALINGCDELTSRIALILDKIDVWKKGEISPQTLQKGNTKGTFGSECFISFMLGNYLPNKKPLCEIKAVEILYKPSIEQFHSTVEHLLQTNNLSVENIDAIVIGANGDIDNDSIYKKIQTIYPEIPLVWYKHIFGESFVASGFGIYVAATILLNQTIPNHLSYFAGKISNKPKNILIYNHYQNKDHSLTLLSSCSD